MPPLITYPNSRQLVKSERATAMVFEDVKSRELLARIEQIAPSDANVLIIGDTGTGKELVARQVHLLSLRADEPFIAVNCGALTESLAESELFGHEKGAFTGAISSRVGWFEAANNGTLFLDEIGDLSLSMQVKLLRVLQEREIVRVGSLKPVKLNVRVIAATNVHLEEAVRAGKFREDLFYRLHVALLKLLPLSERTGDVLPLAYHFVDEYTQRLGYSSVKISPAAEQVLLQHHWAGNIRELENTIHHALLVCKNNQIEARDFFFSSLSPNRALSRNKLYSWEEWSANSPQQAYGGWAQPQSNASRYPFAGQEENPRALLQQALLKWFEIEHLQPNQLLDQQIEKTIMSIAYEYSHRNQIRTAKLLGISRNIVRARLVKHGLIGDDVAGFVDVEL